MSAEIKALIGFDPECGLDANLQHALHWLEGYRARILNLDDDPYSPGSACDVSFQLGYRQAELDTETETQVLTKEKPR